MKKITLMSLFLALAACSGRGKSSLNGSTADQVNCLTSLKQPGVVKTTEDNTAINKFCKESQFNSPKAVKCAVDALAANGGNTKVLEEAKLFCAVKDPSKAGDNGETGGSAEVDSVTPYVNDIPDKAAYLEQNPI